jgi:Uma2 family endonuclease
MEGPYTWDDFLALEEDDRRELIDGELVEVEVPNKRHEAIVALLIYFLMSWARAGRGGLVLSSGYEIRISEKRGVMPDVQLHRAGNPAIDGQEEGLVEGAPDLVVEIVSKSSRRYDRVIKLKYYASKNVPEYWIIDPYAKTLERLVLRDGVYAIEQSESRNAVFRPASFEGLEIPLAERWSAWPT